MNSAFELKVRALKKAGIPLKRTPGKGYVAIAPRSVVWVSLDEAYLGLSCMLEGSPLVTYRKRSVQFLNRAPGHGRSKFKARVAAYIASGDAKRLTKSIKTPKRKRRRAKRK